MTIREGNMSEQSKIRFLKDLRDHTRYRADRIEELDLSAIDTKDERSMSRLFRGMHRLKRLDLSRFDTSAVVSMSEMFQ